MKLNKNDIETILSIVTGLTNIQVKEKNEDSAVIFLENYAFTYELKKDDWYFITSLIIISYVSMNKELASKYNERIYIFSAYDLLELRAALIEDKQFIYEDYLFLNKEPLTIREEAFNKSYIWDYISLIEENNKKA
jgi:hypothetical protein